MTEIIRPKMVNRAAGTKPEPKTIGEATVELLKTAQESLQLSSVTKAANAMMNPPVEASGAKAAAESTEAANKQLMTVFTGLTDTLTKMVDLERTARVAAEKSSSENMQNYFTLIANQAKELTDRMKEMQPPEPVTLTDKLAEMRAFQDIVNEHAAGIAKQVIASTQPALSRSGLTTIDVDLKKLELNQNMQLLQMQQNHEIAMRQMDLEIKKLGMEAARWQVGQQNKQNWFSEAIGAIGEAFQGGIGGGQPAGVGAQAAAPPVAAPLAAAPPAVASAAKAPPMVGRTREGLIAVQCSSQGCKPFAIVPGVETIACPFCNTQYKVSELEQLIQSEVEE